MFSIENTISAWAWVTFSLCACIIEGELSLLCHDVDSTPKVVKLQSNVSLSCALREDCLKSLDANASHIFWKINDTQISRKQYYFNATVSRVTFHAVKGYLTCHINMKGVTNILHRFTIEAGLPPDKPKIISCISYWRKNFTCFWDQGHETYIETHFTVTRIWEELKNDTCFTSNRMCSFKFPCLYISGNLKMIVMAQNALGKAESDPLVLNAWHTWKTDPPQNVTVHSIRGQSGSLLVTWHEPTGKPPGLVLLYGLQYQMVGTGKWIQALNKFEANGIILGYRVWYEKRRDPTVMQPCNTTSLNYSFILTHEAYVVTVVAYNSAGVSPKATLIVPAINQTDLTAIQYVKITPQNNQLLVQWKTSRPPDNGYVIEWCLILDTSPCAGPLHWQHEDNTSEMTYLRGDLERFKRYNISVYAVYNDGPGNPFSVPAYLQQDIPAEGPDIVAPIVKGTEATIKWHEIPVEKQCGFITNYTIFYKSAKGENAVTVNSTVHEYTLKSLQKNTEYTLYIMASTEKGGRNVSTYFTTDELEQEDTVVVVVPVLVCFLLIVNFLIICFRNKHRIKKRIWPDVADPAGSTLADWFHECQYKNGQTPKLLNPGSDCNTDFSTVEVLSLSEESMLQPVRKEKTSQLHTAELECSLTVSPPQQSTSNGEKTNLLQSMNTVMYTVLEQGYKSQIPDISRSLSKQPLLSTTSQKSTSDFETEINAVDGAEENWCPQNTDENDVFQPIAKTNPYLKNSLNVTESQIAPGLDSSSDPVFDNCCNVDKKVQGDTETVDLNLQSSQQNDQLTNPVQTYITVELLGFMLNNEM
ncbi:interleukin-6 receptor subunit beta-like isoform X2 [Cetorhinus maximus]